MQQEKNMVQVNNTNCLQDHTTTDTIENGRGVIQKADAENYVINYNGNYNSLLPCNIPDELKQEGIKIVFEGEVKESKPEELWAAQPFVLKSYKVLVE